MLLEEKKIQFLNIKLLLSTIQVFLNRNKLRIKALFSNVGKKMVSNKP